MIVQCPLTSEHVKGQQSIALLMPFADKGLKVQEPSEQKPSSTCFYHPHVHQATEKGFRFHEATEVPLKRCECAGAIASLLDLQKHPTKQSEPPSPTC